MSDVDKNGSSPPKNGRRRSRSRSRKRRSPSPRSDSRSGDSYSDYSDSYYTDDESNVASRRRGKRGGSNSKMTTNRGRGKPMAGRGGPHNNQQSPRAMDYVTKRMLSARRIKINELHSEIEDLQNQLAEVKKENKILVRQQRIQDRQLVRYEGQENEMPAVIQRHAEEIRTVKEQHRRQKERYQKAQKKLRDNDDELERTRRLLKKMKGLVDDKELKERDELSQKLSHHEAELDEKTRKMQTLEKHVENLNKNHRHELGIERARHKESALRLQESQDENQKLQATLREKEKELEISNIYRHRVMKPPHKLNSSVTSVSSSPFPDSGHPRRQRRRKSSPIMQTPRDRARLFEEKRKDEHRRKRENNLTQSGETDLSDKNPNKPPRRRDKDQSQTQRSHGDSRLTEPEDVPYVPSGFSESSKARSQQPDKPLNTSSQRDSEARHPKSTVAFQLDKKSGNSSFHTGRNNRDGKILQPDQHGQSQSVFSKSSFFGDITRSHDNQVPNTHSEVQHSQPSIVKSTTQNYTPSFFAEQSSTDKKTSFQKQTYQPSHIVQSSKGNSSNSGIAEQSKAHSMSPQKGRSNHDNVTDGSPRRMHVDKEKAFPWHSSPTPGRDVPPSTRKKGRGQESRGDAAAADGEPQDGDRAAKELFNRLEQERAQRREIEHKREEEELAQIEEDRLWREQREDQRRRAEEELTQQHHLAEEAGAERERKEREERERLEREKRERAQKDQSEREQGEREREQRETEEIERAERERQERLEREKREREERARRELEEQEQRAQEERDLINNDQAEQERRRQKDLLLAKMRAIDEGGSSTQRERAPFTPHSPAKKEYHHGEPIQNMHKGKPAYNVTVPVLEKAKKKNSLFDSDNDSDNLSGGYQPTFTGTSAPKAKKKPQANNKKDSLMDDLFSDSGSKQPKKTSSAQQRESSSTALFGGGNAIIDNDEAPPRTNSHLLPRRIRQPPHSTTMSSKPTINAVDSLDDDIEEMVL